MPPTAFPLTDRWRAAAGRVFRLRTDGARAYDGAARTGTGRKTMGEVDEGLVAFTRDRVATLAEVRESRIAYWETTGLIRPTVDRRLTPHRPTRLYDYRDMMSVLIIAELRRRGISLQHIRQIVEYLARRQFAPSEVVFGIAGRRVHFQTPDGQWEDYTGQMVLRQVLLDLRPLRARIARATSRDPGSIGTIERRRGTMGSKAVVAGTRVPVASVRAFISSGASTEDILEAYPDLTEVDVEMVRQARSQA